MALPGGALASAIILAANWLAPARRAILSRGPGARLVVEYSPEFQARKDGLEPPPQKSAIFGRCSDDAVVRE